MFTKMVLPRLGGAASVWSVAMVFFQTTLLAGYAYAHLLTRLVPGRNSIIIHLVVMAAACFAAAAAHRQRMGPAAAGRRGVLAARAVRRVDRAAVLRALGQRSAAAGLVRAHRSPGREGPVFPLCREQCRKLPRADRLSGRGRAVRAAQRPDLALDRRLLCPDRAGGGLRLPDAALAEPAAGSDDVRHRRGGGSDLARHRDLDRAGGGAVRSADRGDRAHLDRRRGGAAVLDDPARDLPPDVRHRLPDQAVHPALAGRRRSAGVRPVPGHRDPDDPDRIDRRCRS